MTNLVFFYIFLYKFGIFGCVPIDLQVLTTKTNMRKFSKILAALASLLLVNSMKSAAQSDPLSYLKSQCPQLTEMYQSELENCHAHYVFAVDVSGSMLKYEANVLPALTSFVKALPVGDKVTLIPFAHDANDNKIGFDVDITRDSRLTMVQMLPALYPHGAETKDAQYKDTDIYKAQQAIVRSIQQNSQYEVNIIIFITDMMHCPEKNIDRQFNGEETKDMETLLRSAKNNAENRVFTLQLPKSGNPVGYVLPSLDKMYHDIWGVNIVSVDVPANAADAIGQWFDKQKNRIMFTKLQSIIIKENKANPIVARTDIDIDGNVTAEVHWTATKLYPKITLDSTYVENGSKFKLKCNKDFISYSAVGEMNADKLEIGKIKHSKVGFHKMADTLHFDVKLPVPYQNEIDKLLEGRPGPVANATEFKTNLVWTFLLPLWLTITLIFLLILYLLLVIKAAGRNSKVLFNGKIKAFDLDGEEVFSKPKDRLKKFVIGKGGTDGLSVSGPWTVDVKKVSPSPFAFWKKPYFSWKQVSGYACLAGSQNNSGRIDDTHTVITLNCGAKKGELTHKVKIEYYKKK